MAIKKISEFPKITPSAEDKILIEKNDEGGYINLSEMPVSAPVNTKITDEVNSLNSRINNIVASSGNDISEIVDARQGNDGTNYASLKARLDAENNQLKGDLVEYANKILITNKSNIDGYFLAYTGERQSNPAYGLAKFEIPKELVGMRINIKTVQSVDAYCKFTDLTDEPDSYVGRTFNANSEDVNNIVVPENARYLYLSYLKSNIDYNDVIAYFDENYLISIVKNNYDDISSLKNKSRVIIIGDQLEIIDGKAISKWTGLPFDSANFAYVSFDISGYTNISINRTIPTDSSAACCLYDNVGNVVKIIMASDNFENITVPQNVSYIKISVLKTTYSVDDAFLYIDRDNTILSNVESISDLSKRTSPYNYQFALSKILCIGDSLTEGAYYGHDWHEEHVEGASIAQNYPYYLGRMLNCYVKNGGYSGFDPTDYYTRVLNNFNLSEYDSFIIWLGTNHGLTDTLETDVDPYADYNDFANTNTGNYCKIISKIKEQNPYCFIVLLTTFMGAGHDPIVDSNVIRKIATKYSLPVIDMSDLGLGGDNVLHGGVENGHFSKAGNIYVASRISDKLKKIFTENPSLTEFGITART